MQQQIVVGTIINGTTRVVFWEMPPTDDATQRREKNGNNIWNGDDESYHVKQGIQAVVQQRNTLQNTTVYTHRPARMLEICSRLERTHQTQ